MLRACQPCAAAFEEVSTILYKVENLNIDESDYGLDFFDLADWRYQYWLKAERENTDARHLPQSGCDLSNLDLHSPRASRPRYRQPRHKKLITINYRKSSIQPAGAGIAPCLHSDFLPQRRLKSPHIYGSLTRLLF